MRQVKSGTTDLKERFKYRQVCAIVRKRISDGIYAPGMRLPPDNEFYKGLNVNKLTAVRALTELAREGWIVRRRGSGSYVADLRKPPLMPGRTLRFGILWQRELRPAPLWSEFLGHITRGALRAWGLQDVEPEWQEAGAQKASRAIWSAPDRSLTVMGLGEARASLVRHPPLEEVRETHCDGLLAVGITVETWLDEVCALGIPVVLADHLNERYSLRADQVFLDPLPAFRALVKHLAGQGLSCIHFVGGLTNPPTPREDMSEEEVKRFRAGRMEADPDSLLRCSAFRQSMAESGLALPESRIHFENPRVVPDAELAARLLALPIPERPEALVCHSVQQAEAFLEHFEERGVPLIVAGISTKGYSGPALPLRANGLEVGATAAELLLSHLHRPERLNLRVGVPMVFGPTQATGMPQATLVSNAI